MDIQVSSFGGLFLGIYGVVFILSVVVLIYFIFKRSGSLSVRYGFLGLSPEIMEVFYSLDEDKLGFNWILDKIDDHNQKFYGDPTKITIEKKDKGCFINDENFKVTLFVNKRKHRKVYLKDGDYIELGNLSFLFINDLDSHHQGVRMESRRQRIKNIEGKIPDNTPCLVSQDSQRKNIFLNKSITYIGKSESNDIVVKVKDLAMRHAMIKRISGKYKLVDLNTGNTFVNNKKADEKFLKHNDDILFDTVRYKFSYSNRKK